MTKDRRVSSGGVPAGHLPPAASPAKHRPGRAAEHGVTRTPPAPPAAGRDAALRFIGRVAQLDLPQVRTAVATWRQAIRAEGDLWFVAEDLVARALVESEQASEQEPLLLELADAFARVVWSGGHAHGGRVAPSSELQVHATEASGQYLAAVAALALLVRDHVQPATFELMYRPFATLIPPADLSRE